MRPAILPLINGNERKLIYNIQPQSYQKVLHADNLSELHVIGKNNKVQSYTGILPKAL